MVHVTIGTDGSVCNISATPEEGLQDVAACVVGMMNTTTFPPAANQCADINIPINYVPKKDSKP
jgi:hypothetical protein